MFASVISLLFFTKFCFMLLNLNKIIGCALCNFLRIVRNLKVVLVLLTLNRNISKTLEFTKNATSYFIPVLHTTSPPPPNISPHNGNLL